MSVRLELLKESDEDKPVGGIIVNINGNKGDLEIFFVNPSCHSKGIGQAAWRETKRTIHI